MKVCPSDKILNPATNRCVSKTGAIGKKLMMINDVKKPVVSKIIVCPSNKILNPATNKCVSKTGAIGKKLMMINDVKKPIIDKNKVEELYGVPNKNKLSVLMKTTFKLFPFDHSIDKEQVNKFIQACDPEYKEICKKIIDNTEHISFEKFLARMNSCIYNLMTYVNFKRPIFIYLGKEQDFNDLKTKSNYWLYLYVKEFIRYITNEIKDVILITDIKKSNLMANDIIVLIDDCIYSGQQMGETVRSISTNSFFSYNFYLLVPYISSKGLTKIKSAFNKNKDLQNSTLIPTAHLQKLKSTNHILSSKEIEIMNNYYYKYWWLNFNNKYLIYFDHKLADKVSTITHFYLGIVPSNANTINIANYYYYKKELFNKGMFYKSNNLDLYNFLIIIPLFKNCKHYTKNLNIMSPKCPAPPYKDTFKDFINLIKNDYKPKSLSFNKKKMVINDKPKSY